MERACALREQGLLLREIAAAMGVALKTVHGWLSDPDGAKPRLRTERHANPSSLHWDAYGRGEEAGATVDLGSKRVGNPSGGAMIRRCT